MTHPIQGLKANYSQRLVIKGPLIEETYRVMQAWSPERPLRDNIARIRESNTPGTATSAWLIELGKTLSSRFSKGDDFTPLVVLAKGQYDITKWSFCLLWHISSTDLLFRDFMVECLTALDHKGVVKVTTDDVQPFVRSLIKRGLIEKNMTEKSIRRVASDLLRAAGFFGILEGKGVRRISHPVIPEDALLYAIYSLWESNPNADRLIASGRWRQFLMTPFQVEHELLNLHQFHRLRYERAGSIRELKLPHESLVDFCKSLVP